VHPGRWAKQGRAGNGRKDLDMAQETKTMVVVFMTILTGWIGFSLPFPIFSHLFLNPEHGLVSAAMPETTRTLLLGVTIAIYPLGQIIGSPLLGRWSDRYGRKRVLQYSLWATVLGSGVLAVGIGWGSVPLVLLGRFLSGLGEGNLSIAQSIASDISTPQSKARNFAAIGIAVDLGFIVGPLLGGVLSDRSIMPWFSAVIPFWVATAFFIVNALAVPFFLSETSKHGQSALERRRPIRATLVDPRLAPVYVFSFLTFWAIMIFFDFFAVYFVQVFRTPPAILGVYTALISVPLIVSGLYVNRFVNRFGIRLTGLVAVVLMGAGIAWFTLPTQLLWLAVPIIVICIGINFGQTATAIMVSDAAPAQEQGQALGLYRANTVAASGLSALAGGALAGLSPLYPFYTAMLCAAAAAVVLLAARNRSGA